jgi:hypothetical protein
MIGCTKTMLNMERNIRSRMWKEYKDGWQRTVGTNQLSILISNLKFKEKIHSREFKLLGRKIFLCASDEIYCEVENIGRVITFITSFSGCCHRF